MTASSRGSRPNIQFRQLRVEPRDANEFLPGQRDDGDAFDISSFSGTRYVVTFEIREDEDGEWHPVRGEA